MMYQLSFWNLVNIMIFISFTLLIKLRVNIYMSWTVYKVILGENLPHN